MDIRWLLGALGVFLAWASQTKITFILLGHAFVIPVLILIAFLLALACLALIALVIRSLVTGSTVLGWTG